MATLVVKNLPDHLHEVLRQMADRHHRSINKETISLIEAGISPEYAPQAATASIRIPGAIPLSDADFERALTDETYARRMSLEDMEHYMDELRADRDEICP